MFSKWPQFQVFKISGFSQGRKILGDVLVEEVFDGLDIRHAPDVRKGPDVSWHPASLAKP